MKNFLFVLAALAAVIVAGVFGYKLLTEDYSPQQEAVTVQTTPQAALQTPEAATIPVDSGTSVAVPLADKADRTADFTVYNADGSEVKLSDSFGKPIVVNFWATWCSPCRSELPAFNTLYEEYGGEVEFMMVNLTDGSRETVSGVKRFSEKLGYTFPVYYDITSDAAKAYTIYSIPTTLFIAADGTLQAAHTGSMTESTLKEYIDELIGEN